VWLSVGSLGSLLLLSSVVVELFFRGAGGANAPTPADLLECNAEVRTLLIELGETAAEIQKEAATGDRPERDLGARWETFSRAWQRRWETVNARCRFDELADTTLGPAYNRMAEVHRKLPRLKLAYQSLLKKFTEDEAAEIARMREALDKSRELLEQEAPAP
jgi:hypothetical protein